MDDDDFDQDGFAPDGFSNLTPADLVWFWSAVAIALTLWGVAIVTIFKWVWEVLT